MRYGWFSACGNDRYLITEGSTDGETEQYRTFLIKKSEDLTWVIFFSINQNNAKDTNCQLVSDKDNKAVWSNLNLIEHLWKELKIRVQLRSTKLFV